MKLSLLRLVPVAALAACSSASPEPAPSPAPAEPAAVEETPCDEGSYRTLQGACTRFASVSLAPSPVTLAPARDHHTSIVRETADGPYLYVFGGGVDNDTMLDDVQRAKISPDGSLGAFEQVGKLPAARAGHCIVDLGERVLLLGGYVGRKTSATSVTVAFDAAGHVSETAAGPDLPLPVMHLTCDRKGDYVYVLGGKGANERATRLSARVKVDARGTVGGFEAQTALTPDRSHHAAFVRGDRLYVVGGISGSPNIGEAQNHKDAISAAIGADGVLGAWEPAGELPKELSVSAALLHDDAVYLVGGLEGEWFTTAVRRATFATDGTLTKFVTVPAKLAEARGHVHQLPSWGSFFYSVGGKNDLEKSIGTVEVGRFE